MKYLSVAEGRALKGLRLVLSRGIPGPWSEAAKAVMNLRNVPYAPVGQEPAGPNDELVAWTGMRNAPIAVHDNEPPLSGWHDILMLAERLGSGPSLLPASAAERALSLGFTMEIASPGGFGWNARMWMMARYYGADLGASATQTERSMLNQYGFSAAAVAAAPTRVADILQALARQMHAQRQRGSEYLVGSQLHVVDLYWACFSQMIAPLSQDVNPMPDYLRNLYQSPPPEAAAALEPVLIEHRDCIFRRHIGLPLNY